MEAILPSKEPITEVAYSETKPIVRSLLRTFESHCLALEYMFRALHSARVHNMRLDDYNVEEGAADVIRRYAPTVRVRYLCFRKMNFGWACDKARFCT